MSKLILKRLLATVPLLFGITLLVFFLMSLTHTNFLTQLRMTPNIPRAYIDAMEHSFGLNEPWYVQYVLWIKHVLRLDFGYSWTYHIPITDLLAQRIPATLFLALSSLILTWLIAIPIGLLAAAFRDSIFDKICNIFSCIALSIPEFFLALIAVFVAAKTGLLPCFGKTSLDHAFLPPGQQFLDYLQHLILPTLVLSACHVANTSRILRANALDYLRSEFVTTARAKGLSEFSILFKHVLKNALNPLITHLGFAFSSLLSGSLLIENVMNYPGLGQLIYEALTKQDQYLLMAIVVVTCLMLILGNLLADVLLGVVDPRVRRSDFER